MKRFQMYLLYVVYWGISRLIIMAGNLRTSGQGNLWYMRRRVLHSVEEMFPPKYETYVRQMIAELKEGV